MAGDDIYKRSYRFALEVIKFLKQGNPDPPTKIITHQLIRAITSISANLAEGSAAVSKKEFINYIGIARKSAVESVHWLKILFDCGNKDTELEKFIDEGQQIVKIISKIVINSKK